MLNLNDVTQEPYATIKVLNVSENEDNELKADLAKTCEYVEFWVLIRLTMWSVRLSSWNIWDLVGLSGLNINYAKISIKQSLYCNKMLKTIIYP